jgi:hypothetical protein
MPFQLWAETTTARLKSPAVALVFIAGKRMSRNVYAIQFASDRGLPALSHPDSSESTRYGKQNPRQFTPQKKTFRKIAKNGLVSIVSHSRSAILDASDSNPNPGTER